MRGLGFIRCVALDYDGTLTLGGPVERDTADALARARREGLKLVLVTGRILAELFADDAEVDGLVDAIVAENGAVVRLVVPRVSSSVYRATMRCGR